MIENHIMSEDDFLSCIGEKFPNTHSSLILGRGDDCAEIACPPRMAVSTDLFVEDTHFRRNYFSPFETGYKALAVNISDMAAAGAKPLGVSIGLVAPVPFSREEALGIIDGMASAAAKFDIALTGGDLSRGDKLAFCVTIWGEPGVKNNDPYFLRRGPVREGDTLFLCGRIGLARAGLMLLEEKGRAALTEYPASCKAHLTPEPLVETGLLLAGYPACRLMDVSDGLMRDLPRMLRAYGVSYGAATEIPEASLHPETIAFAGKIGENPALFAFTGGEDYALLGCCPEKDFQRVMEAASKRTGPQKGSPDGLPDKSAENAPGAFPGITRLGTVTKRQGITLNGKPVTATGFDHFGRK